MSYDDATRIAGELFGNLLARDSDENGFIYAHKSLLSGEKSPRMLVREFMTSDEFRELHLMNQTPNEFARRVLVRLFGFKRPEPERIKEIAVGLVQGDWRLAVRAMIDSPEYSACHGDHKIPLWT